MVERIVAAAERVIAERGYDGATTNHIATEAGISPGSLYQYFPNKHVIVRTILERFGAEVEAAITAELSSRIDAPLPELATATFTTALDVLGEHRELLRAVIRTTPEALSRLPIRQRLTDTGRVYFQLQGKQLGERQFDTVNWLLLEITIQLAVRYILDAPPIPRDELVREYVLLVTSYLTAGSTERR